MPVLNPVLYSFLLIIAYLGGLWFVIYLMNKVPRIGYVFGILLIFSMPFAIKALGDTVEPSPSLTCTACQETFSENYSYCPYCGKEMSSSFSLNGNGAEIDPKPSE